MKKLILVLLVAVAICGAASAQTQKGGKSVGVNFFYATDIDTPALDLRFNYCITDTWRIAPSFTYFFPKKTYGIKSSFWAINADVQYLFNLTSSWTVYPLAGLSFMHSATKAKTISSGIQGDPGMHIPKYTHNDVGLNIGGGAEYSLNSKWSLNGDLRFKIKDGTMFMIGVGGAYKF